MQRWRSKISLLTYTSLFASGKGMIALMKSSWNDTCSGLYILVLKKMSDFDVSLIKVIMML